MSKSQHSNTDLSPRNDGRKNSFTKGSRPKIFDEVGRSGSFVRSASNTSIPAVDSSGYDNLKQSTHDNSKQSVNEQPGSRSPK